MDLLVGKSFPSGHASSSAALAGILIVLAWSFLRRPAARWAVTVVAVASGSRCASTACCSAGTTRATSSPAPFLGVSWCCSGSRSSTRLGSRPRDGARPEALVSTVRAALRSSRRPGGGARPAGLHEVGDALPRHHRAPPEAGAAADPGDVRVRRTATSGRRTVRELWDGATHREERYAATALARHRAARAWQDPAALDLYRHLVVTGAWWDHVDEVASHLVGGVLAGHRAEVTPVMRAWARRRRPVGPADGGAVPGATTSADTDTDLLRDVVEANVDDRSFWLRKAIGWALREHCQDRPGLGARRGRPARRPAVGAVAAGGPASPHRGLVTGASAPSSTGSGG